MSWRNLQTRHGSLDNGIVSSYMLMIVFFVKGTFSMLSSIVLAVGGGGVPRIDAVRGS